MNIEKALHLRLISGIALMIILSIFLFPVNQVFAEPSPTSFNQSDTPTNNSLIAYDWINPAGGVWSNPANWSPVGVPGIGDLANITLPGAYVVIVDNAIQIDSLAIGTGAEVQILAGNGLKIDGLSTIDPGGKILIQTGELVVDDIMINDGTIELQSGTIGGNGLLQNQADLLFTGNGADTFRLAFLTNDGTASFSGNGTIFFNDNAQFTNLAAGTIGIFGNPTLEPTGAGGTIINDGALRRNGAVTGTAFISVPYTNNAGSTVSVSSGLLRLNGNTTDNGSSFSVAPTGRLLYDDSIHGDTHLFKGTSSGAIEGQMALIGGTLTTDNASPGAEFQFTDRGFQWSSGTITGSVSLTNTGNFSITSNSTKVLGINLLVNEKNMAIYNNGTIEFHGSGNLLNNGAAATLEIVGNPHLLPVPSNNIDVNLFNTGAISRTTSTMTATISVPFTGQSGTMDVDSGTLLINGDSQLSDGTYSVALNSELLFDSSIYGSFHIFPFSSSGAIEGRMALISGTLWVRNVPAEFQLTQKGFEWAGGTISGTSPLTNSGNFSITTNTSRVLRINQLVNENNMEISGDAAITFEGIGRLFNNGPGATLEISSDPHLLPFPNNNIVVGLFNSGTIKRTTSTMTATVSVHFDGDNGNIEVDSGTLLVNGDSELSGSTYSVGLNSELLFDSSLYGGTHVFQSTSSGAIEGRLAMIGGSLLTSGTPAEFQFTKKGFEWAAGTISGTSPLTNSGNFSITGSTSRVLGMNQLVNENNMEISGDAAISFEGFGRLWNLGPGATLEISGDPHLLPSPINNINVELYNSGTIKRTTSVMTATISVLFKGDNNTIDVDSGTLLADGDSDFGVSSYSVALNSALLFDSSIYGGEHIVKFTASGPIDGRLALISGSLLTSLTPAEFQFTKKGFEWAAGTISGTSPLTNTGNFSITGSTSRVLGMNQLVNENNMEISGDAAISFEGFGRLWNLGPGATLEISGDPHLLPSPVNNINVDLFNSGTIKRTTSTMTATISVPFMGQSGTMDMDSGTLLVNGDSQLIDGSYSVALNSELLFDSSIYGSFHLFPLSSDGIIEGRMALISSTLLGTTLPAEFQFTKKGFEWAGGTISGSLPLTNTGNFSVTTTATKTLSALLVNQNKLHGLGGTVTMSSNGHLFSDGETIFFAGSGIDGIGQLTVENLLFDMNGSYDMTGLTLIEGGVADFDDATSLTFGNLTQDGGTLNVDTAANIEGHFVRNGGTFVPGAGSFNFNGNSLQNLTLAVPTTFNDLTVSLGTTLIETVSADNGTVAGNLTNNGIIRKIQTVGGTGTVSFGLTAVSVDVTTQGTLSQIDVDRIDSDHPDAKPGIQTGRYWTVTPTGAGFTLDLTLLHDGLSAPKGCRYLGAGEWDCGTIPENSNTATTVTRLGVTNLSDWAVGNNVDPTAIRLRQVQVTADNWQLPTLLMTLLILLSLLTLKVGIKRPLKGSIPLGK